MAALNNFQRMKKFSTIFTCYFLIHIVSFLYPHQCSGQSTVPQTEPDSSKNSTDSSKSPLDEILITAQYRPCTAEKSIHKIRLIDRKKIESMGAQNLKDVLSNELNIRISNDPILGSSMSLQGMAGQHVKILVDGVPILGRINGNIDISQINMNDVERIEIIEGPLSVNYGSDALAGTINIIMKKKQNSQFELHSNSYYESSGIYNFNGRAGYQYNKISLLLTGGRHYFDGWRTNDNPFLIEKQRIADTLRSMNWKPREQFFGTIMFLLARKNMHYAYTSDYFLEKIINRGRPRLPYYETAFDDIYTTQRINNAITINGNITKHTQLNFLVTANQYKRIKNTYFNDLTTLNPVLTENRSDQDTTLFAAIVSRGSISRFNDSTKFNYEMGFDINHETGVGLRIKNKKQSVEDYALFGTVVYKPVEKLIIKPGVRFIYNTSYNAPIVPAINIKYNGRKGKNLRLSYAKGFRSPSLKELYFYFADVNHFITGNENLNAEHSHNFSMNYSFAFEKNEKSYQFEINTFYNSIRDLISLSRYNSNQYKYFNIDLFKSTGITSRLGIEYKNINLDFSLALIGRYNYLSKQSSTPLFVYSPEGRFNLQYKFPKSGLTLSLFHKYSGAIPSFVMDEYGTIVQTKSQSWNMADVTLRKPLLKGILIFTIGSKNLFNITTINGFSTSDAHSENSSMSIGTGRTYFIQLDINLATKK